MIDPSLYSGKPALSIGEILGLGFITASILLVLLKGVLGWEGGLAGPLQTEYGISRGLAAVLVGATFVGLWFISAYTIGRVVYRKERPSMRRSASDRSNAGED
jgi:hypothetical protein